MQDPIFISLSQQSPNWYQKTNLINLEHFPRNQILGSQTIRWTMRSHKIHQACFMVTELWNDTLPEMTFNPAAVQMFCNLCLSFFSVVFRERELLPRTMILHIYLCQMYLHHVSANIDPLLSQKKLNLLEFIDWGHTLTLFPFFIVPRLFPFIKMVIFCLFILLHSFCPNCFDFWMYIDTFQGGSFRCMCKKTTSEHFM